MNCVHCKFNRKRTEVDGVFYHTFKESNGMDYDTYTVPCGVQTKEGLRTFRNHALTDLRKHAAAAAAKLRTVESLQRRVRKAATVNEIQSVLYHTEFL
jgi:hypothetical protein